MSTVPPVSRDAQTHHLALPKIWLSEGILSEVPDMEFSYYPQLLDILYYLPVKYNMDIFAKYIHFSFGLGCALLIFFFIRRYIGNFWGLLGGLMFLTLPVILKLSVTVYVDLGLLFFFTASLFSSIIWLENTKKIHWLIIGAICSGLAMSTKYNAILSVVILALLIGYYFITINVSQKKKQLALIKYVAIFTLVSILVYSPWLIRNYSLTGNPIYPLHNSIFSKSKGSSSTIEKEKELNENKKLKPLTIRKLLYDESLLYSLAVPIRVFYEGQDNNLQLFDGKLNPFLLIFSLLLLLFNKSYWQNKFLAFYVLLTLTYTLLAIDMRIRYIITITSPMIVLSIFGLYRLHKWLQKKLIAKTIQEVVILVLIIMYFSYNFNYGIKLFNKIDPIPYINGDITRDQYIDIHLPYYSLNKLANREVSTDGKLLGIFTGNRRYYIDVPLSLDSQLIFEISKTVNNADELTKELSKLKITHILARVDLTNNQLSRQDEKVKIIVGDFFSKNTEILERKGLFTMYKINLL